MNTQKIYLLLLFLLVILSSCKKNEEANEEQDVPIDVFTNGVLVVNEGLFHMNNSTMSWVGFSNGKVNNKIFEQKTGRQLGDTGNDVGIYGGKIYVVVNVSNTIEVLDAKTGVPIKQIDIVGVNRPAEPRFVAFHGGKVFIPSFDGYVDVIDTLSLEVIHRIPVGANPDGCHVANGNKLYVANSGGLSLPFPDSTMSVIDMDQMIETHRIVVGKNPRGVISDKNGDLYINVHTDSLYEADHMWVKVNHQTLTIDTIMRMAVQRYARIDDKILVYMSDHKGLTSEISLFDPATMSISKKNLIDPNMFTTFYGMQYDSIRQQIYCFDAMKYVNKGYLRVFSKDGKHLNNYAIGLNPSKLAVFY